MKHYTYIIYNKAAVATTLLLLLLFASCSKDSSDIPDIPDEPKLCTVTISLQAPNSMRPVTKADPDDNVPGTGWEEEEALYERKMEEWVVVAYNEENKYAGLVNTGTVHDDGNADNTDDENDDYKVSTSLELPEGKYTFFAFANWKSLDEITIGDQTIKSGNDNFIEALKKSNPAELKAASSKIGDMVAKYNATDKKPIPMSSYGHLETIAAPTDQVSLPLIRMIAKVRVLFDNQLNEDVKITTVKVGKFQGNRSVYLVPWDLTNTENNYYLEFDEIWQGNYVHRGPSFPDNNTAGVAADTEYELISDSNPVTIAQGADDYKLPSYYVNESIVHSDTHTSNMVITVARASTSVDGTDATTVSRTDFAFVRRNDLLEIPVLLSKFSTTLKFGEVRLPIGVFPTKYEFGTKNGVQVLTPITYNAKSTGEIQVEFTLDEIFSDNTSWNIRYPKSATIDGVKYSGIQILSNSNNLLIDPETHNVEDAIIFDVQDEKSGSFKLRTQELANTGVIAQILLTLIVEYGEEGNKRDIEIPYTINITNAPESTDSGTTTKGGNV